MRTSGILTYISTARGDNLSSRREWSQNMPVLPSCVRRCCIEGFMGSIREVMGIKKSRLKAADNTGMVLPALNPNVSNLERCYVTPKSCIARSISVSARLKFQLSKTKPTGTIEGKLLVEHELFVFAAKRMYLAHTHHENWLNADIPHQSMELNRRSPLS